MTKYTLESFGKWSEVSDYESDETTVVLLDSKGGAIAEFSACRFTLDSFNYFKSIQKLPAHANLKMGKSADLKNMGQ